MHQNLLQKCIEVSDLSRGQYSINNDIRSKTSMLGSGLCHCSDAYIVLKGTITVERDNDDKTRNKN